MSIIIAGLTKWWSFLDMLFKLLSCRTIGLNIPQSGEQWAGRGDERTNSSANSSRWRRRGAEPCITEKTRRDCFKRLLLSRFFVFWLSFFFLQRLCFVVSAEKLFSFIFMTIISVFVEQDSVFLCFCV